ncbi:hypothetical protein [Parendozoicomonas haliclonae]|uniref:Uncharacterized protein n=2 Tax=Parendozoicomonas haliclonae TaxID=1960125 RepID=A0A1X7AN29_9GAMM|nr:hypothetical protein [Parendozoicomonas haliclonae]SMA49482.1 hypothetical protein EHSB41UT_03281 [Parendozoicomonas haliclonae]
MTSTAWANDDDLPVDPGSNLEEQVAAAAADVFGARTDKFAGAREQTPAEMLFSQAELLQTEDGQLQLALSVAGGAPESFDGLLQAEDEGSSALLTLDEEHDDGYINAATDAGSYGRLFVRRVKVSLDDVLQGPVPGAPASEVFEDDIYRVFRQLLTVVNLKKDYLVRDALIQAGSAVITHRANGDLDIGLYRKRSDDGSLEYLGQLLADKQLRYELQGPISTSEYQEFREAVIKELQALEMLISQQNQQIAQMTDNGEHEGVEELLSQVEKLKERFRELYKEIELATEFEWFAITESLDYSASNWVKIGDEGGLEVAAQAMSYKVMSSIVEARAGQELAEKSLNDLRTYVYRLMEQTRDGSTRILAGQIGAELDENVMTYLTRQLSTAWNAIQGLSGEQGWFSRQQTPYELPAHYTEAASGGTPLLNIRNSSHYVTSGLTLQETLEQIKAAAASGSVQPDKYIVSEAQLQDMRNSLSKSGWGAWAKSFIWSDAYKPDQQSETLREILAQRNTSLHNLFTSGVTGGIPVHVIDTANGIDEYRFISDASMPEYAAKAQEELNKANPKVLTLKYTGKDGKIKLGSERLTDARQQQIEEALVDREASRAENAVDLKVAQNKLENQGILKKVGSRAASVGMSAGMGWITGMFMQGAVDAVSKYHNEGVLPWNYTAKDREEMNDRAFSTGKVMAANAAVSDLVLPYVADSRHYFEGVSGQGLLNQSLTGKYEASIAGGIAGVATRSAMAGYQYWNGEISGSDLAWDIADATARAVPVTVGSIAGHALLPYTFQVPVLSTILPVGFMGAVAGSMAGSAAYDTAKYYAGSGIQKLSGYYYGTGSDEVATADEPAVVE